MLFQIKLTLLSMIRLFYFKLAMFALLHTLKIPFPQVTWPTRPMFLLLNIDMGCLPTTTCCFSSYHLQEHTLDANSVLCTQSSTEHSNKTQSPAVTDYFISHRLYRTISTSACTSLVPLQLWLIVFSVRISTNSGEFEFSPCSCCVCVE